MKTTEIKLMSLNEIVLKLYYVYGTDLIAIKLNKNLSLYVFFT